MSGSLVPEFGNSEITQPIAGDLNATVVQPTAANLNAQVERTDAWSLPDSTAVPTTLAVSAVSAEGAALAEGKYLFWSDVPTAYRITTTGIAAVYLSDKKLITNQYNQVVITAAMVAAAANFPVAITSGGATTMIMWRVG